jgi:hypothetical protein
MWCKYAVRWCEYNSLDAKVNREFFLLPYLLLLLVFIYFAKCCIPWYNNNNLCTRYVIIYEWNAWSEVLESLRVMRPQKKFAVSFEPRILLSFYEELGTNSYSEPNESTPPSPLSFILMITWHVAVCRKRIGKHVSTEMRCLDANHCWVLNKRTLVYDSERSRHGN